MTDTALGDPPVDTVDTVDTVVPSRPATAGTSELGDRLRALAGEISDAGALVGVEVSILDDLHALAADIDAAFGPKNEYAVIAENMQRALDAENGHVVRAARRLGLASKTVYLRLGGTRRGRGVRRHQPQGGD